MRHSRIFVSNAFFSQSPQSIRNSIGAASSWSIRHRKLAIAHKIVGANRDCPSKFRSLCVSLCVRPKLPMHSLLCFQSRDSMAEIGWA